MNKLIPVFITVIVVQLTNAAFAAKHGVDLYDELKYPADFTHFEYANPEAIKGGDVVLAAVGTFDSLNPFVIKGDPAAGLSYVHSSLLYATLLAHSYDEPISAYGYIAESVEVAPDRISVTFTLRKQATFHDGSPITPEDVVFTFNIMKEKGQPFYRTYYREIIKAEKVDDHQVKFTFASSKNRELPVIIGEMPILSQQYYQTHEFSASSLEMPLGNGPYKIEAVDAGKSLTYSRVKNWWGENLPVNKGRYNFDLITYLYFRDATVAFEAFKAGEVDFRLENSSKNWSSGYDFPALNHGFAKKLVVENSTNQGMQAFVFNARRPVFQDKKVRQAVALAFDFEWANDNLFYSLYERTNSFFENSELAAHGLPQGEELQILEQYKDRLPAALFTQEFRMPVNDKPGAIREQLKQARNLLETAGWVIKDQKRVHSVSKAPLQFEILIADPTFVRVISGFVRNLKQLGIGARVRVVDSAQYIGRVNDFDFDIIVGGMGQSESPGNEQLEFWGSRAAAAKGSQNYAGIKNPIVDNLIELVIDAPNRASLVQRVRALDRVLLWEYYVVPLYYNAKYWLAIWDKFDRPAIAPKYVFDFNSWWIDPKLEARLIIKDETQEAQAAVFPTCPEEPFRRYRYRM